MLFAPSGSGGGLNAWATGSPYAVSDIVNYNMDIYKCTTAHTASAAFETDFSANKWQLVSKNPVNYISDNDGSAIGLWTTYADAAGTNPVDGTGGSPTVTYAVSTSSTMRGTTNFLFTHAASNQQGNGFSYDFSIDPSDKGKVLQISLEYLIASGTYADDDLQFWIYDVTNAALIQPAPYKLKNSGIIEKFAMEFQTSSSSTSYRLIAHVATSTATAYTIRFDNWNLGPQAKLYGSANTDWVSYTPTGGWTNTTYTGKWRRVGDSLECYVQAVLTGTPVGNLTFSLPSGLSIDTSKLNTNNTLNLGTGGWYDSATTATMGVSFSYGTTTSVSPLGQRFAAAGNNDFIGFSPTGLKTFVATDYVNGTFKVPILGWSSSQVMSSDADTRVVAATFYRDATFTYGASASVTSQIKFNKTLTDSHNGGGGSAADGSWFYTVPVSGWYSVTYDLPTTTGTGTNTYFDTFVVIGPTSYPSRKYATLASVIDNSKSTVIGYANAGQTIYVSTSSTYSGTASTFNYGLGTYTATLNIQRVSGPSQIMASETVSALYTGAPPTGTLTSSYNITTFGTKVKDSHGAYSSGSYTIPVSGQYDISAQTEQAATYVAASVAITAIFIDGVQKYIGPFKSGGANQTSYPQVNVKGIPLLSGQVVTIRSYNNGTIPTFGSDATINFFSITRSGNY